MVNLMSVSYLECYMYVILFILPFLYIFMKKKQKILDFRMTEYGLVTSDSVLIWKKMGRGFTFWEIK